MTSDVVLTAALRNNLLSLKGTQGAIDQTQLRLATGLKVNSALDNPQSFFASSALNNRASDLQRLLDGIGQSTQVIKAADNGVSALTNLLNQADSIVQSAQDVLAQGSQEARLLGDVDLSGVSDITALTNINDGDTLTLTAIDPDTDAPITLKNGGAVTLDANDSIQEIITEINDLNEGLSEDVIEASLNSDGQLQIRTTNGGALRVEFETTGGGGTDSEDQALAAALGFGESTALEAVGDGTNRTAVTSAGDSAIRSSALTTDGTTLASASTALTDLNGFSGIDDVGDEMTLTINGETVSANIDLFEDGGGVRQTIQGVVDAINNDTNINTMVEASFDATTGKISINALSPDVESVEFTFTDAAGAGLDLDFGFGTGQTDAAFTANSASEIIRFGESADQLRELEVEYDSILGQINQLVGNGDTGYRGTNLLNGDSITTYFNEFRTSSLTTEGVTFNAAGLGLSDAAFIDQQSLNVHFEEVRASLENVRAFGTTLANDLSVIETREQFTTNLINTLEEGADKLTLADQNEEGAKLLALQTRQQLGVTSLALASQSQQSILRLF